MVQYFSPKIVDLAFQRLASETNTGKKPLERTSALMYFFAFDAAAKKLGYRPLNLDPKASIGKSNRDAVELEFVKLVTLKSSENMQIRQVSVLGKIEKGGRTAEKRISSNFLTVPLKKASESAKQCNYPSRPAALLKMGEVATGMKWGADYHDSWQNNLPKFVSELRSNTPFTDLAIFVFRDSKTLTDVTDLKAALSDLIVSRYSEGLANFWIRVIEMEKMFFKHGNDPFTSIHQESLSEVAAAYKSTTASDMSALGSLDKSVLINRIFYLEELLDSKKIKYQSIAS